MVSLKSIINELNDIENKIDIVKLHVFDFNTWPFVRLSLIKLLSKEKGSNKKKNNNIMIARIGSAAHYLWSYLKNPIRSEQCDVVYFTRESEFQDSIHGKRFNRYSDTLKYFFANDYKIKTLHITDTQKQTPDSDFYDTNITFIDFFSILARLKVKIINVFKRQELQVVTEKLNQSLDLIYKETGFELTIIQSILYINELSKQYEKILRRLNPQVLFLACFYRSEAMAMALACNRLDIKCVEYQHGIQNDYHSMYTHWNNIPSSGYKLIPDLFWVWGEVNKNRIEKWALKTQRHRAEIGGNLWMAYQRNLNDNEISTGDLPEDKPVVLFSLQGDDNIPSFFIDFLRQHKEDFIWLFRDHPRVPLSENNRNLLNSFAYWNIADVSNLNLYSLLKNIDIHITGFSTVAFEAQSFEKPTIFVSPNALNGFQNLLGKNGLYYAQSVKELKDKMLVLAREREVQIPDKVISSEVSLAGSLLKKLVS